MPVDVDNYPGDNYSVPPTLSGHPDLKDYLNSQDSSQLSESQESALRKEESEQTETSVEYRLAEMDERLSRMEALLQSLASDFRQPRKLKTTQEIPNETEFKEYESVEAEAIAEAKIAKAEQEIQDMKQWLLTDSTYPPQEVDKIISRLTVRYDEDSQKAIVGGSLWLYSLTSAEGLELPQSIGRDLNLPSLTSAKGLTLPQSIGRDLNLPSLTSAEGLVLPQSIGDYLYLGSLTLEDRNKLRAQWPKLADNIRPRDY